MPLSSTSFYTSFCEDCSIFESSLKIENAILLVNNLKELYMPDFIRISLNIIKNIEVFIK